jgi:hypothetical protein
MREDGRQVVLLVEAGRTTVCGCITYLFLNDFLKIVNILG